MLELTQQDVYDFLKDNKGLEFTPRQVSESMGISVNAATNALRKLREHHFVNFAKGSRRDSFVYWL
ncbi:hypothetical protein GF312_16240 [Candidatus Poribacteria bacterium]|nr:hypothetical protein [Candidatus Poribacteria bacterium]